MKLKKFLLWTIATLMMVGLLGRATGSRPTYAQTQGVSKIAFMAERDGERQLYTVNPDGSELTKLANLSLDSAHDRGLTTYLTKGAPAWSPAGTRITFTFPHADDYGGVYGHINIFAINADGSGLIKLTNHLREDADSSAWSPDGTYIAFVVTHTDNTLDIAVMNLIDCTRTHLTEDVPEDFSPTWSPEGSRIAFASDRDTEGIRNDIYVMNADGSGLTRLTDDQTYGGTPAWSPDGTRIAFAGFRDSDDSTGIYVMNAADGSGLTRLTHNSMHCEHPAWSPDGTRIAFTCAASSTDNPDIYVINANGSGLTNITNSTYGEYDPAWSPILGTRQEAVSEIGSRGECGARMSNDGEGGLVEADKEPPATAMPTPDGEPDGDSGFPWWLILMGLPILAGLPWIFRRLKGRFTRPLAPEVPPSPPPSPPPRLKKDKKIPPTLIFVEPEPKPDRPVLPPSGFRMTVKYKPGSSPIDPSSLRVKKIVGGPEKPLRWLPGPGPNQFHADVPDRNPFAHGEAEFRATIKDLTGQIAKTGTVFYVDAEPPGLQMFIMGDGWELWRKKWPGVAVPNPTASSPIFPPCGFSISIDAKERPGKPERQAGLDAKSIQLIADFDYPGIPAGNNLLPACKETFSSRAEPYRYEGVLFIKEPLQYGNHKVTLIAADRFRNENKLVVEFSTSREVYELQLVDRNGSVLRAVRPILPGQAGESELTLRERLFFIQIIDPNRKVDEELSYEEWMRARKKTLTAELEIFDPNNKRLWGPEKVTLRRVRGSSFCFRSERFVAYEQSKPPPANANKWAIPAIIGGKVQATLEGKEVARPVEHTSLRIDKVDARVTDDGTDKSPTMKIGARFRLDGMKLPTYVCMTLSGGGLAEPIEEKTNVINQKALSGQRAVGDAFFQPDLKLYDFKLDPNATYTLTLYPVFDKDNKLPTDKVELPACSVQDVTIWIRGKETDLEKLKPLNPYASPEISAVMKFKPVGHARRGAARVRCSVGKETFAESRDDYEPIKPGKPLEHHWKPRPCDLRHEPSVLEIDVAAEAVAKEKDSRLIYRVRRAVPVKPQIDKVERQQVTIEYRTKGSAETRVRTIRDPSTLRTKRGLEREIAVPSGSKVTVDLAASATSCESEECSVVEGIPLTLELEGEGTRFLEPKGDSLTVTTKTGEGGRIKVRFQVPDIGDDQEQGVVLSVQTPQGEAVEFPFIVSRPIVKVEGKVEGEEWVIVNKWVWVIVNSQPGFRVTTRPHPPEEVTWDLMVGKKVVAQGEGVEFQPKFERKPGREDDTQRVIVRHRGDERALEVRVIDLHIGVFDNELGQEATVHATLSHPQVIDHRFLHYRWSLQKVDDPKGTWGDWVELKSRSDDGRDATTPRLMYPGMYRVKVERAGGHAIREFEVTRMAIKGPSLLAPGEQGTFEAIPDTLQPVEWFLYKDGKRQGEGRSHLGATWDWLPQNVGDYRLTARWERWQEGNEALHNVIVAVIEGDDKINSGHTCLYSVSPHKLRGVTAAWRVTFVGEDRESGEPKKLIEKNGKVKVHNNRGEYRHCVLEAAFHDCPGLGDVTVRKKVYLSEWRGKPPCEWRYGETR